MAGHGAEPVLNPGRLGALAEHLGEPAAQIAQTLHAELAAAMEAIDAGLTADDPEAVSTAAHAARNSALMIAAAPTLTVLRTLEAAVGAGDRDAARAAHATLRGHWLRLSAGLREIAAPAP